MKKLPILISTLVIGLSVAGVTYFKSVQAAQTKTVKPPAVVYPSEKMPGTTKRIEASEYATLKDFVDDTYNNLQPNSDYQKIKWGTPEMADQNIAESGIEYTTYFRNEIEKQGLNKDFEELNDLANKVLQNHDANIEQYRQKVAGIHTKVDNEK